MESLEENACQICSHSRRKYVCPRCNISYCSVECYQSDLHKQCSENFYRQCILEELKLEDGDPEAQRKMLEILKRNHSEENEEIDSDDDCDLSERLKGVDLDDADSLWQCLTESEQQEFEALVTSGDVTDLVPLWEPWWNYKKKKTLVQELHTAQSTEDEPFGKDCPRLKTDVPQFSQISKQSPSVDIKWNIVNVLAAYCYVARYFNGDHKAQPLEAACLLEKLSGTLRTNYSYLAADIAVDAVLQDIVSCFGHTEEMCHILKDDVRKLLSGPEESNSCYYILAALSDIHQLLSLAHNRKKSGLKVKKGDFSKRFKEGLYGGHDITKEQLFLLKKKVEYYLSWANEYLVKMPLKY